MGDMVILLSLTEALYRRFGRPVDVVSSGGWTRPLLEGQPSIAQVLLVGSRKTPYALSRVQREIARYLERTGPRPAWICDEGPFAPRLLRRAGIGDDWQLLVRRDCTFRDGEQHADRLVRFATLDPPALRHGPRVDPGSLRDLRVPPLRVMPAWRDDLRAWLKQRSLLDRPLYLVQAGNKRTMRWWAPRSRSTNTKYWPEERWSAVIEAMLRDDRNARVILLGVPAEVPLNEAIARLVNSERLINAADSLPMRRLLALQEHAHGMISVDTGPAHSAAAVDCPLVVLFGEADTTRYAPRSPSGRVQVLADRLGTDGILGITAGEVIDAWRSITHERHVVGT
jgi:heptosyltransferase-2/heptosyltransferase-3